MLATLNLEQRESTHIPTKSALNIVYEVTIEHATLLV